jgi:hypothetical protein
MIYRDGYLDLRNFADRIIEKQKHWLNYVDIWNNTGGCAAKRVELWQLGKELYFNYGGKNTFVVFKIDNDRLSYICTYNKGK